MPDEAETLGMLGNVVVFISYSHDSDEHRERVLGLAERLRQDGLDTQLDQYLKGTPEQGGPRWMLDQIDKASFVLVVCSQIYYRRFRGHEMPDRGKAADWEGALITQAIYDARSRTAKFVPVMLAAGQEPFIPEPLRGQTSYELTSEERYQDLYRFLVGEAGIEPSPLGDIKPVTRQNAKSLTLSPEKTGPRRSLRLLWLLPTVILLPLVLISATWHVPTRVQLEVATARLAFTPGGQERREILNRSVPFSSLIIEGCKNVVFAAEKLEAADPQQLVPGMKAGEAPHFPATAWREIKSTDPVQLSCNDRAAKLTLKSTDPAAARLGILDRIYFKPGSQVILEVSPEQEPTLSIEIDTPQDLHLALGPDLELVADLVKPDGIKVPFPGDLQTYRARLPEARRMVEVTSSEHGLVLIVTPTRDQLSGLFAELLDLPLSSVEMLEEDLDGRLVTPLRDEATLRYPDYPAVPSVTIKKEDAVGLGGLSDARLRSLRFDAEKGALRATFDGTARRATTLAGAIATDRRLTLYHIFRYNWPWALIAIVAAWLVSTTWAAFGAWKKLQE